MGRGWRDGKGWLMAGVTVGEDQVLVCFCTADCAANSKTWKERFECFALSKC